MARNGSRNSSWRKSFGTRLLPTCTSVHLKPSVFTTPGVQSCLAQQILPASLFQGPGRRQLLHTQMAEVENPNDPLRRGPYVDPAEGTELHQTLKPVSGRVIAIGDVHGCFEELIELLEACNVDPDKDAVIIVGDMVNKGPLSLEVVRYVRDNDHVYTVMGNHEGFALMHYDRLKKGEATVDELLEVVQWVADMTEEEAEWMRALPYTIAVPQYDALVVHAGLIPDGRPLGEQNLSLMYRVRNMLETTGPDGEKIVLASEKPDIGSAWIHIWKGPEYVIFGHDAKRGLQQTEFAIGLDSGCCYGRQLSAIVLPEKQLIQVDAKTVHSEPKIIPKPET